MANENEVTLLIKAKNEASKALDATTKQIKELSGATDDSTKKLLENDKTLKELNNQTKALQGTLSDLSGIRRLITNYEKATVAAKDTSEAVKGTSTSLKSQQKVVEETARDVDRAKEAWLEAKRTLDQLTSASTKDKQAIIEQRDAIRRLREDVKTTSSELTKQERELRKLTTAYDRATDKEREAAANLDRYGRELKQAGVDTSNLSKETARLDQSLEETNAELVRADKATKQHVKSLKSQAEHTRNATKQMGIFSDNSRKAMSVTQRLRGEVLSMAGAYIGLYGAVAGVTGSITSLNEQAAANAKLMAAIGDETKVAEEMEFIDQMATRLGLDLKTLEKTYSEFFVAAKKGGEEAVFIREMFENIAEGATVMKLSTDDFEGALRAMIQIMSKGVVMSEELQGQLAERFPGAVSTFAKAVGVSTMELRKMMEQSQLTSDQLLAFTIQASEEMGRGLPQALSSLRAELNRVRSESTRLQRHFAEIAEGNLKNALQELGDVMAGPDGKGAAEAMATAFTMLVDAVRWTIQHLDEIKTAIKLLIAYQLAKVIDGWVVALGRATKNAKNFRKGLQGIGKQLVLITATYHFVDWVAGNKKELEAFLVWLRSYVSKIGVIMATWQTGLREHMMNPSAWFNPEDWKKLGQKMQLEMDLAFAAIDAKMKQRIAELAGVGAGAGATTLPPVEVKGTNAAAAAEAERRRKEMLARAELSEAMAKYEKAATKLTEGQIDSLGARLSKIDSDWDGVIAKLEKYGKDEEANSVRAYKDLLKRNALQKETLRVQRVEQEQYQNSLSAARNLSREVQNAMRARKQTLREIQNLRDEGTTASIQKANELQDSLAKTDKQINELIDTATQAYQKLGTEEAQRAVEGLELIRRVLNDTTQDVDENLANIQDQMAGGLTDGMSEFAQGIGDALRGVGSLSDAFDRAGQSFAQFAGNFLIQIGEMIAQAWILKYLQGTGFGGGIASVMPASVAHDGGIAGSVGRSRGMDASLIGSAVRYHSGGIVGLAPNEVPAILERGEEVITRNDPRHALNGGGSGGQKVEIIDQRGTDAPPLRAETTRSDGMEKMRIFISDSVKQEMSDGSFDKTMTQFGVRRKGTKR